MAARQEGKRRLITELFEIFANAAMNKRDWKLFPIPVQEQLEERRESPARVVSDFIASLGEQRAVQLHSEVTGVTLKTHCNWSANFEAPPNTHTEPDRAGSYVPRSLPA